MAFQRRHCFSFSLAFITPGMPSLTTSLSRDENTGSRAATLSRPTAAAISHLPAVAGIGSRAMPGTLFTPYHWNAQVRLCSSGVWREDGSGTWAHLGCQPKAEMR